MGVQGMRWSGQRLRGLAAPSQCVVKSRLLLGCIVNKQLRRCLLITVECAETGGGSCLDDRGEARLWELLREKACQDCVTDRSHVVAVWLR